MANYSNLKAAIAAAIKTNGNQEITGQVLQDVLTSMVSVIGDNYTFTGVATPDTNPGTPDQNVVYMASQAGTYSNFNGTVLPAGISLMMWNGAWTSINLLNLDDYQPIIIEGDVTNAPDEEDLTSVNERLRLKNRNTRHGMGCIYLRRELGFAEQLTQENTIYVIRYDYTLTADVTVPANCVLKFDGGSLSNGTLVLQNTLFDGVVKLGSDLEISGTCANHTAYQSWFEDNDIDAFAYYISHTIGFVDVEFCQGEFMLTIPIELYDRDKINIHGNSCHITTEIALPITINGDSSEVDIENAITFSPVGMGERAITVSNAGDLSVGDIIAILDTTLGSFSPFRQYYQQGEYVKIQAIEGNVVTLTQPIYGYYVNEGSLVILKRHFTKLNVCDLTITNNFTDNSHGIYTKNIINSHISGINVKFAQAGISVHNSLLTRIDNCDCACHKNTGNSYGIMVGNSQNVIVDNCRCTGRNHGISTGGAGLPINIPLVCRFITIENCILNIQQNIGNASIWFHGNIEYGVIQNCVASQIRPAGNHCKVLHCTTISNNANASQGGILVYSELSGYDHLVEGNTVINGQITAYGIIGEPLYENSNIYANNPNIVDECVRIVNNVVQMNTEYTNILYGGSPSDTYTDHEGVERQAFTPTRYKVKCYIAGNTFKTKIYRYGQNMISFAEYGTKNVEIVFENNDISAVDIKIRNISCDYLFKNNTFRSNGSAYAFHLYAANSLCIENCIFKYSDIEAIILQQDNDATQCNSLVFMNNTITTLRSTNGYVVRIDNMNFGTVDIRNNSVINIGRSDGAMKEGVNVGPNATIDIMRIEANKGINDGRTSAELQHSIAGTINKLCYGDVYLSDLSQATIANLVITNDIMHKNAFSNNYYLNKDGRTINDNYTPGLISGNTGHRPTLDADDKGYKYFDESIIKSIFWTGTKWIEPDGATASVRRSGVFANKPDAADIYVGFKYFCTDRQTTEGATNGIEIIHKGNNVWVDALGRVVS